MANSKDRADKTTRVAADGARKGNDRATDTARKVAGAAPEPIQHAFDEWTRGVKEGVTRYQEMFSQLPGFGVTGAEVGETRSLARKQLIEFNTELLSYAQRSLNDSFEASKAVINAANMQEAMQIQVSHARKAMQEAGEQARKVSELYAKASGEVVAKPMSRGMHDAAEPTKKGGFKGANETAKQVRLAG